MTPPLHLSNFWPKKHADMFFMTKCFFQVREELHKEYSLIQRISSWMQTLDDHSTVRHQSFITFRRRFEITSQNDPAWKQVLEQEVVQLQVSL